MKTAPNWISKALGLASLAVMLGIIVFVMFRSGEDAIHVTKATALLIGFLAVAAGAAWVWSFVGDGRKADEP